MLSVHYIYMHNQYELEISLNIYVQHFIYKMIKARILIFIDK